MDGFAVVLLFVLLLLVFRSAMIAAQFAQISANELRQIRALMEQKAAEGDN